MKTLVVYYSRTGNTKKVALDIAKNLKADIDELKDKKKRGFFGVWLKGAREAMKESSSEVVFSKDPKDYDLIVLGGPVWAWNLIPPIRKYLEENKNKIKKLGFFVTCGGNIGKNFEQTASIKKPIACMKLIDKEVKKGNYKKELEEFIKKLK
jgi:flavodoxin